MTDEQIKMADQAFDTVRVFIMKCGPRELSPEDHVTALDFCDLLTDLCSKPWVTLESRKEALDLHGELMAIIRRQQWQ